MTLGYPMSTALAAAVLKRRDWRPTRLGNLGTTSRPVFLFKASSQIQPIPQPKTASLEAVLSSRPTCSNCTLARGPFQGSVAARLGGGGFSR